MWPSDLNPSTKYVAAILSIGILEVNMLLYHKSLPASTFLVCSLWCFWHDDANGLLFFGANTLLELKDSVPARGLYELWYLIIRFNLKPIWYYVTLKKMMRDRNNQLYVKVDDMEIEIHWIDFLSTAMIYRRSMMMHHLAVGMIFNVLLSASIWHLSEIP